MKRPVADSPSSRWLRHFLPTGALLTGLFLALVTGPVGVTAAETTGDVIANPEGHLRIVPIQHATLALEWNGRTILVDPVGGAERFQDLKEADLILVTDVHGDHLNVETLQALTGAKTWVVAPSAVAGKLPSDLRVRLTVLSNGQKTTASDVEIEAIAAYKTTPERKRFHAPGRGNGYVLSLAGQRVYISGDTEDIPEMRALRDIDVAFVCMNLPYTMTVEQAADAVRAFRPKVVYPYHCRGSDLEAFKSGVGEDLSIEVRIRDWYKS